MVTIVLSGNAVFALVKGTEIVPVAIAGPAPAGEPIMILNDAPNIQIKLFSHTFRAQNFGSWGDDVISRDIALAERLALPIFAQFTANRGGDVFRENRTRIAKADPGDNAVGRIVIADPIGLDTNVGTQLALGGLSTVTENKIGSDPQTNGRKRKNSGENRQRESISRYPPIYQLLEMSESGTIELIHERARSVLFRGVH
jgi:hypothetical protein